ncbi:VOC family protein [Natrarchaeobius sp. A-rgal3]|uniref:VOC family protein n=1 Tax=Natrarchaeobius versutus TaxID=1679078 RepID=UPI00350EC636
MTDSDLSAHHVGITVDDLEETLPFYRDVLGFPVADRFDVSGEAFSTVVGVEGASAEFVHLEAGGVRVELVEYGFDATEMPTPTLERPGASHVGFAHEDVETFYEGLPEDVPTTSEPQTTASGSTVLFVRDPEGNLVELIER